MAQSAFDRGRMNKQIKVAIDSFKLDKRFWKIVLLDFAFFIILFLMIALFTFSLRFNMDKLKAFDSSVEAIKDIIDNHGAGSVPKETMSLISSAMDAFLYKMIALSLIFIAIILLVRSYFKQKVWSIIKSKNNYLKSVLYIASWNALWLASFILIIFGLRFSIDVKTRIAVALFFVYLYFGLFYYPLFDGKIKASLSRTFKKAFTSSHYVAPTLVMVWICLSIISSLTLLIGPNVFLIAVITITLLYSAWAKQYISGVV